MTRTLTEKCSVRELAAEIVAGTPPRERALAMRRAMILNEPECFVPTYDEALWWGDQHLLEVAIEILRLEMRRDANPG